MYSQGADFYHTFWSLLPFSLPPLSAEPQTFGSFKDAVNKVLPVIKEATAKDCALMASKSNHASAAASGPLKRKRDPRALENSGKSEYYFAKYLVPAARSAPPLAHVHEGGEDNMVHPAQPLTANGLHARSDRRTVGAGDPSGRAFAETVQRSSSGRRIGSSGRTSCVRPSIVSRGPRRSR